MQKQCFPASQGPSDRAQVPGAARGTQPTAPGGHPLWWLGEHRSLGSTSALYRWGRVLALLYEEGVLSEMGFTSATQVSSLTIEDPAIVLRQALLRRRARPQETYLAHLAEGADLPCAPLHPEERRRLLLGYQRELALLVLRRWVGCQPAALETM